MICMACPNAEYSVLAVGAGDQVAQGCSQIIQVVSRRLAYSLRKPAARICHPLLTLPYDRDRGKINRRAGLAPAHPNNIMERKSLTGLRVAALRLSIAITAICLPATAFSAAASGGSASAVSHAKIASVSLAGAAGSLFSPSAWTNASLGGIDPKVFALALEAASSAVGRGQATRPSTLTVIDYSKPST